MFYEHKRHTIRLQKHDYSLPGYYFVTISSYKHYFIFGKINKFKMELNETGKIINDWIGQIPKRFSSVKINSSQIMPNHIHLIIQIVEAIHESPLQNNSIRSPFKRELLSLVIGYFKMNTTKIIRKQKLLKSEKLWQRNYYEHIIRDKNDLTKHQFYILNNPKNWYLDKEYPDNLKNKNLNHCRAIHESPLLPPPSF